MHPIIVAAILISIGIMGLAFLVERLTRNIGKKVVKTDSKMDTYAERLKHKNGLVDALGSKTVSDYKKREDFYKAYQDMCDVYGYELLPTHEGEPSAHDSLIVVDCENPYQMHTTLVVPWYDADGNEESWS